MYRFPYKLISSYISTIFWNRGLIPPSVLTLIGESVNIKVKTDGGIKPLYKFTIYKNGVEKESIDYGTNNWINFIPEEVGEYEVDIKLKDEFSSKDYDASTSLFIKAKDYIEADIDYILLNSKETYLVGDIINIFCVYYKSIFSRTFRFYSYRFFIYKFSTFYFISIYFGYKFS